MVADTNVINEDSTAGVPEEQIAAPMPSAEPSTMAAPPTQKRTWSMPKAPVSRKQVDEFGQVTLKAARGVGHVIAALARYGARVVTHLWRAIEDVPAALRVLFVLAVLMLLAVVGSIALSGTPALVCAIVVVPVSSIAVGALGHRWYSRHSGDQVSQAGTRSPEAETSDLARSVVYVDKKLTLALNSFGSERHQQAVIALFQAKTAVELALGTEQDTASHIDEPVSVDDYGLRPRIQAGSASASLMPESTSLAAS